MSTVSPLVLVLIFNRSLTFLNQHLGHNSAILDHTLKSSSELSLTHRKNLGELFQAISSAFPHVDALVRHSSRAMSDAITIEIVYLSIGPFFVVENSSTGGGKEKEKNNVVLNALGGAAAVRGLRLSALSLIRRVSVLYRLNK